MAVNQLSLSRKRPSDPVSQILLVQTSWDEKVLKGIAAYAREHSIEVDFSMRWTGIFPTARRDSNVGIIAEVGTNPHPDILDVLRKCKLPVVDVSQRYRLSGATCVSVDATLVAEMVVAHFASRLFENLTLVVENEDAFSDTLKSSLRGAAEGRLSFSSIRIGELAARLTKLRAPHAFVASNDLEATQLLSICIRSGLKVPDDVAILGIGDSESLCSSDPVGISSVDTNLYDVGYRAAQRLEQILKTGKTEDANTLVPPLRVRTRRSTDTVALRDPSAAAVLRFLRENFRNQIDRWEIQQLMGNEPMRTERMFRKYIGLTVIQELGRLRIDEAMRLLVDERLTIEAVGRQSGFDSRYTFERAFLRAHGCTPRAYRRNLNLMELEGIGEGQTDTAGVRVSGAFTARRSTATARV